MGWVLAGLIGLIALTLMPSRQAQTGAKAPDPGMATGPAAWIEALSAARPASLERLIQAGHAPGGPLDGVGSQPLHVLLAGPACQREVRPTPAGVAASIDVLLAAGADVNAVDQRGNSPLSLAVFACDRVVIEHLLQAGADAGHRNSRGLSILELTLAGSAEAADALIEAGFRLSPKEASEFRRIYADEPVIMERVDRAAPNPEE